MTLWNEQLVNVQEGMDKTSADQKKNTQFMYIHFQNNKQSSVLMPLNWINECKVYM